MMWWNQFDILTQATDVVGSDGRDVEIVLHLVLLAERISGD
jgi:hypothetical protein